MSVSNKFIVVYVALLMSFQLNIQKPALEMVGFDSYFEELDKKFQLSKKREEKKQIPRTEFVEIMEEAQKLMESNIVS